MMEVIKDSPRKRVEEERQKNTPEYTLTKNLMYVDMASRRKSTSILSCSDNISTDYKPDFAGGRCF